MSQFEHSKTNKQAIVESTAEIKFTFDSNIGLALSEALKPEASLSSERFVQTKVNADDTHLTLKLNAQDLGDLRAGINSYFNLVKASYETLSAKL